MGSFENLNSTPNSVNIRRRCFATPQVVHDTLGFDLETSLGQQLPNIFRSLPPFDGVLDWDGLSGTTATGSFYFNQFTYFQTQSTFWNTFFKTSYSPALVKMVVWPLGGIQAISSPGISTGSAATGDSQVNLSLVAGLSYVYGFNGAATDCDANGVADRCDILQGVVVDHNGNDVPDSCENLADCDSDGIDDVAEIATGEPDCDGNSIPDSCEIAVDPALDSEVDFSSDGVLDRCQGRVQWTTSPSSSGIKGAVIKAYWVSGTESSPNFNNLAYTQVTDASGRFILPRDYFTQPQLPGEIGRGIKAQITYVDDTGVQTPRTIVNYPGWDPLLPVRTDLNNKKIYFPLPVVFQAGVHGRINTGSVDYLRSLLIQDAGSSGSLAAIKRGVVSSGASPYFKYPIPSFLFFAIPSSGSTSIMNDGISWGYNNSPISNSNIVSSNASKLQSFIVQRVKPKLDQITEGGNASNLPLNIGAHSYGGIISRHWMTQANSYPKINRYVSFDGVQGGTEFGSGAPFGSWFTEFNMNGGSSIMGAPPQKKGWNYSNKLGSSLRHLMLSADDNLVIEPFTSALGIGRTIISQLPGSDGILPNGHCERFIGGWELPVFGNGHSIQNYPPAAVTAARFFSYGNQPSIGSVPDPAGSFEFATVSAAPTDQKYATAGCNGSSSLPPPTTKGSIFAELNLNFSGQTVAALPSDIPGIARVSGYLNPSTATFSVLDSSGSVLAKINQSSMPYNSNDEIFSFDVNLPVGANSIRLSNSSQAYASVQLTFPGDRFLIGSTNASSYSPNSSVIIRSRLESGSFGTLVPSAGTILAKVTSPTGLVSQVTLYDDGVHNDGLAQDGVYGNLFNGTSNPGFYLIRLESSLTVSGQTVVRHADSSFQISSTAASLSPSMSQRNVDSNGNGLIDSVAIDFNVTANAAGTYRLSADIVGANGQSDALNTVFTAAAGSSTMQSLILPLSKVYQLKRGSLATLKAPRLVLNSDGLTLSENSDFSILIPSANTLELPPIAEITAALPNYGSYIGGYKTILKGTSFSSTKRVSFGGRNAKFAILDDETIEVIVPIFPMNGQDAIPIGGPLPPPSPPLSSTLVDIKVTTAAGSFIAPNSFTFVP